MDRREFLCSLTGASVAMRAVDGKLRIGFLGVTHSHAAEKIKVVRESPAWDLAGISEEDAQTRARYAGSGVAMLSARDLLEDHSIQAVAVESDVQDHARHARMALEAGKHVHLEKPPAASAGEFRALAALAASKGLLLQLGYMWRFHPGINAALEAARRGWLGDVYLVRGMMNTLISADQRPAWGQFRGGQMFEQGCHLIDPTVRLLGRPSKITAVLKNHGLERDGLADNTAAILEWPRALAVISSSVLQPGAGRHRSFEVLGSNGTMTVRPIEPPSLEVDLASPAGPYRAGSQAVTLPPFRRYAGEFGELAAAIRERRPLGVTPEEDLAVHETLLLASGMEA